MTVLLQQERARSRPFHLAAYIAIARPDHWIKNIFLLPGFAIALSITVHHSAWLWRTLPLGIISLCLIASANYTINEYLDAETDRFHPLKCSRPGAQRLLDGRIVLAQYVLLVAVGCGIAAQINLAYLLVSITLLAMGVAYNVPPLRSKDRIYLDVLSESVNNPLRFLLGWFIVVDNVVPPCSVLIAYWMGGAFLMAIKRYSEFRRIGDADRAALYRRSFRFYTEQSLLLSAFFYALCFAFFMAIFLVKYRVELVFTFPLFSALFTWYLALGMQPESATQAPEKLYREVGLLAFAGVIFLAAVVLSFVNIPFLEGLMEPSFIHLHL